MVPPHNSPAAKGKPNNTSLVVLASLFALSGLSVFFVPGILQNAYYQEEEANRKKNAVIVGTRTDTKPPNGSSNPYQRMPAQQGGRAPTVSGSDDSSGEKAENTPSVQAPQ